MRAEAWAIGAACSQSDPEAWFPEKGESTRRAKAICFSCDVRLRCLDEAIGRDEQHGVWGGMSLRERRRERDRRLAAAGLPPRIDEDLDDEHDETMSEVA